MAKKRFPNVPAELQDKMESCVKDVKREQKLPKSRAIPICFESVVKEALEIVPYDQLPDFFTDLKELGIELSESDGMNSSQRRTARRKAEREITEAIDAVQEEKEVAVHDKSHDEWRAFGGAETFEEVDQFLDAQEEASKVREAAFEARSIVDNILGNPDTDMSAKGGKIASVGNSMRDRMAKEKEAAIADMGFIEKALRVFKPEEPEREYTGFKTFVDTEGNHRWFGWVSNKWRDRDKLADPKHGGEIISEAAHKEFVGWLDTDPARMPKLWPWHTKDFAHENRADFVEYCDGFLVMSGTLEEKEAEGIGRVSEKFDLGMSHGMYVLEKDIDAGVIEQYRSFEVSYLPVDRAANVWTDFTTIQKEVGTMGMNPEKREMLAELAGEDFVKTVEDDAAEKAATLDAAGVDNKEVETPESTEEVEKEAAEEVETAEEVVVEEISINAEDLSTFLAGMAKESKDLGAVVSNLVEKVDGLLKGDAEKVADLMNPDKDIKEVSFIWDKQLSESEDNIIEDKESDPLVKSLKESDSGYEWLGEVLGSDGPKAADVPK